eukprot:4877-Heterococcus_DN1.PRE.1
MCSSAEGYTVGTAVVKGAANCAENLMNQLNSLGDACHSKKAGCWMSPLYETFLIARAQAIIALFSTIPVCARMLMSSAHAVLQQQALTSFIQCCYYRYHYSGYWMTVATVDTLGRRLIQNAGFLMMTLFLAILAGAYTTLLNHIGVFVWLYAMTFFFANWGPNATTFIIPSEVFPSKWRCTVHGFSAACGKA